MSRSPRTALSLVEVLVIIAILAILIGLLIPVPRRARDASGRLQCMNNLRQVMIAMHCFESDSRDRPTASPLPGDPAAPAGRFPSGCFGPGAVPEERLSWMVTVLPYMEQNSLFQQFDLEKGCVGNLSAAQTTINTFRCPTVKEASRTDAVTNYVAISGVGRDAAGQPAGAAGNGFMGYDRLTSLAMIKDGASNTIALMETQADLGPWARGGASTVRGFDPDVPLTGDRPPFGGSHPPIINTAMADGSVRSIRNDTDPKQLAAWITIAGGEPVEDLD